MNKNMLSKILPYLLMISCVGLAACEPNSQPEREHNPLESPPIDSARGGSITDIASWPYRHEASADLDGDGTAERVVITSDVQMDSTRALWEDGHRWGVYAESQGGERTLLYSAFVPNGFVEAAILTADNTGRRRILVQERTPQQVRALEVEYEGPGKAKSSSAAYYQIGEWLPGSASLR